MPKLGCYRTQLPTYESDFVFLSIISDVHLENDGKWLTNF